LILSFVLFGHVVHVLVDLIEPVLELPPDPTKGKEKYQQPPFADNGIRNSYKICHNGSLSMQHDYDSIMPAWVL
jgi:hypothetical protein